MYNLPTQGIGYSIASIIILVKTRVNSELQSLRSLHSGWWDLNIFLPCVSFGKYLPYNFLIILCLLLRSFTPTHLQPMAQQKLKWPSIWVLSSLSMLLPPSRSSVPPSADSSASLNPNISLLNSLRQLGYVCIPLLCFYSLDTGFRQKTPQSQGVPCLFPSLRDPTTVRPVC